MAIRTRFAPSPTGYMHIGNLRTALYAYLVAKKDPNGVFILRIEDTDQGRLVEGATDIIYETLKACNLKHDEGPDVGGAYGSYVQSERVKSGLYMKYAKELIEKGGAHYCFCDEEMINAQRELQEARGESFKYDDPCKLMTKEQIEKELPRAILLSFVRPFQRPAQLHLKTKSSVILQLRMRHWMNRF